MLSTIEGTSHQYCESSNGAENCPAGFAVDEGMWGEAERGKMLKAERKRLEGVSVAFISPINPKKEDSSHIPTKELNRMDSRK